MTSLARLSKSVSRACSLQAIPSLSIVENTNLDVRQSNRLMSCLSSCTIVAALLAVISCHDGSVRRAMNSVKPVSSRVRNLHAFARLYGVVRWFHPSDAASVVNWERVAVDGTYRVIDATDSRALHRALVDLISPVAPMAQIVDDENFVAGSALAPRAEAGLELVAWEHLGYGDSTLVSAYASKRRHRGRVVAVPGTPFASLHQVVDATPFRGGRLRLRGKLRTANHGLGRLWMRVDREDKMGGFFENMRERPVVNETWTTAEIIGTVAPDASRIVFGMIMAGSGTVWYDDIELSAEVSNGVWKPIDILNSSFESEDLFGTWRLGTGNTSATSIDGWYVTLDHSGPTSGKASLRIEAATKVVTDELFADAPAPGETVDVDLGQGLRARVPVSLYSKDGQTIGDDPAFARRSLVAPPAPHVDFDPVAGIADVIVVWNVLEHFWPYWDVVSVDWQAELDIALSDALDDRSMDDHVATLQRLTAVAADAHSSVMCGGTIPIAKPPFAVDMIEGEIIVTATSDKNLARGDVIVSVNGRPASELLSAELALTSGSPQWRRVRALQQFGGGAVESKFSVRVRRGAANLDLTVTRGNNVREDPSHRPIERLSDGVYYIDLGRANMTEIDAVMDQLATAPGVVFDLRSYPNSNRDVLSHLINQEINTAKGMSIPHVIRPDHGPTAVMSWETSSSPLPVRQPHIEGRVAFLTGPTAFSFAESMMATVEHYHLGAIVGSSTAGTNGNKAQIAAPTGCRIDFTGMRVTKPDGTRLHLVGVQPTIPASRTIAGVAAGRDEVLEQALSYIRTTSK